MKKKVVWLPYDFDTAIGINNEGSLVFDYALEDIDHLEGGANVFNGQDSVIWCNIRDAFRPELAQMYQSLRSTGALSYEKVEKMFEEHQAKWPEAIFNEDAWFKYIQPLIDDGSGAYLKMLQGSKAEQRKWWLYNRFRYIDSKYNAGDALSDLIQLRGYAKADITVRPYADIYPSIKYGSYLVQKRGKRGVETTLECPVDDLNDTEIYIYSSSQLASVGDLSGLKVGFADFSMATKLQDLKIGDAAASYENPNLNDLTLGNNVLLKRIDVRNCTALTQSVDLSGCSNIEEVYFDGSKVTGVTLPNGGVLKKLHLPATITNLTILNQRSITDLVAPTTNLSTLRLENNSAAVDTLSILRAVPENTRVRLIGFWWEAADSAEINGILNLLDKMRGMDENGNNMNDAQVSGTIHTNALTGSEIASYNERYPYLKVTADHTTSYLYYYNYDGSQLLYTESIQDGGDGGSYSGKPSRASTAANTFSFIGWSKSPNSTKVDADALKAVVADRKVYAAYSITGRTYTVRFYNGSTLLYTANNIPYGGTAAYVGDTPVSPDGSAADYPFEGWSPQPTNIQGDTTCYAQYGSPLEIKEIADSWDQILAACADGSYATKYKVGNYKPIDLGSEGIINMQIVGKNTDELADGSGTAPLSWVSMELLATSHRMNPDVATNYIYPEVPSWTGNSSNVWTSQNRYNASDAKATWTITAESAGTLSVKYKTSNTNASRNAITVVVNGEKVADAVTSTTEATYTVECAAGDTVTVYAEFNQKAVYNYYGTVTFTSTGTISVSADVQNAPNRTFESYKEGTGAVGNPETTEMYAYQQSTLKSLIPENVRSKIKTVKKYTRTINTAGQTVNDVETNMDIWLPSMREMSFNGFETKGPQYKVVFKDNASRIKKKVGAESAVWFWARSATNSGNFYAVNSSGSYTNYYANTSGGVPVGFCS